MSEFFVGQKVVCVNAAAHFQPLWPHDNWALENGKIYEIRDIRTSRNGNLCLWLSGINRGVVDGYDEGFNTNRFRPLESKAISLFRKIARDVTEGRKVEFVE